MGSVRLIAKNFTLFYPGILLLASSKGRGYRSQMAYYPERMSNITSTSSLICLGSERDPLVADQ